MARTRSAKGEIVDFDLLRIREKLAQKPISLDVKAREDFIDKKLRRRIRKAKQASAVAEASSIVDSGTLSSVETPDEANHIDQPKADGKVEAKTTKKQKYRPPVK